MKRREFIESVTMWTATGFSLSVMTSESVKTSMAASELPIPKRMLGKTGVEVSGMALGGVIAMQIKPSDEVDPVAIAETALNFGITYFDTAPSYNSGQSETNYGHVLASRRNEVFLACKTGDRSCDGTLRSIEQSLKRLQTDHVDLLQIHGVGENDDPEAWGKNEGVYTALCKLRDEKVTRFIGVTGHESAEMLRRAIEMYEFDTLLTTLNPIGLRRPYREKLLSTANKKRMGVIAMKVFGGGNGCLVKGNPLQNKLRPYHDDTPNQTESDSLIRYTLGLPITSALMGVASLDQLKANIRTVREKIPMSRVEQKEMEKMLE